MEQIREIFQSQKAFFATGQTRDLDFRIAQLTTLEQLILSHQAEIIQAIQQDFAKPAHETLSSEIGVVIDEIRLFRNKLRQWAKPMTRKTPITFFMGKSQIYLEPRGLSLIIAPWNYPFQLCFAPLVGAIAAGQCVIMKPSELTVKTTELIQSLIARTFKPEYVAVIDGGVLETTELLKLPFDHIFFTGSTEVGRIVQRAAAENLVPTVLELGGKSPAIVTENADLKLAVQKLAWGKFFNAGQTCVAPDYVYVHTTKYDEFFELMKLKITEFYGSNPEHSSSYARIVNDRHFERLLKLLDQTKIVCGGGSQKLTRYIAPTVMRDVDWSDRVMGEEIFGPILPVMKYSSLPELIQLLKQKPKPLSAYFFSDLPEEQNSFVSSLSFGGGVINDCVIHVGNSHIPFGGVGPSGMGNYHGYESLLAFSHQKSVMTKYKLLDLSIRYPPYTAAKVNWVKRFFGL